jgi:hypothetical protein
MDAVNRARSPCPKIESDKRQKPTGPLLSPYSQRCALSVEYETTLMNHITAEPDFQGRGPVQDEKPASWFAATFPAK